MASRHIDYTYRQLNGLFIRRTRAGSRSCLHFSSCFLYHISYHLGEAGLYLFESETFGFFSEKKGGVPMTPNGGEQRTWRGISLFKVAGIRINLDFSWFIIFGLVLFALSAGYLPRAYPGQPFQTYWVAGLIATLLFFASVMLHELAHSLGAIRHGIDIPEIPLFIFGGVSRLSQEPKDPGTEFKIAVVGPLTSFALAAVFGALGAALKGFEPSLISVV